MTKRRKAREWYCVADYRTGYLNGCTNKVAAIGWKRLLQQRAEEQFLKAKYRVIKVREVLPRRKRR